MGKMRKKTSDPLLEALKTCDAVRDYIHFREAQTALQARENVAGLRSAHARCRRGLGQIEELASGSFVEGLLGALLDDLEMRLDREQVRARELKQDEKRAEKILRSMKPSKRMNARMPEVIITGERERRPGKAAR